MRWAVLLAGGSGTRFWPLSTPDHPKQLLPLTGSASSAEDTVERLTGLIPRDRILVVAPFLSADFLARVTDGTNGSVLASRPDSLLS